MITGAAGFVGSHLAEECVRRGWTVHGTARPGERAENLSAVPAAIVHSVELSDADAAKALIELIRPAQVYHLAAQPSVQKAWQNPMETLTNNIGAQLNVLRSVQAVCPDTRVLVVSSSEVYGRVAPSSAVDEDTPLGPLDPYSVSKVTQEMLGLQHFLAFDLPVVRVRPFNHAGPRQRSGFVAADFARQVAMIEAGLSEPVIRVGNLSAVRDISDVRDVVRAYTLALCEGDAGAVYNVASGHGIAMGELLQAFIVEAGVRIETLLDPARMRPIDRPFIVGNADRLRARTGWTPAIPLSQTVRDTLDYWRSIVASSQ